MRPKVAPLKLSRETIRELNERAMRSVAGGAVNLSLQQCNVTLPPTLCQCTGTETQDICH